MCCGVCALSVHVYCDSFHVPYTVLQNACISSRMKYLYIGGGAMYKHKKQNHWAALYSSVL